MPRNLWSRISPRLRRRTRSTGFVASDGVTRRARSSSDLAEIDVPGVGSFRMWRLGGRDQVARDVAAGGLGGFEAPMPSVFAALVGASGGTVLDVGANTGFYSLLAVTCGAERVVAFEPFSPVLECLRSNLAANDASVAKRIDVVPYAVGATTGSATLHIPPPTGSLVETSASLSESFKDEIAQAVEVPVVTVDGHTAVDGAVSVIKVDVEGMDHRVLEGASRCMREHRPVVFVEVLPRAEMALIERLASAADYRILPVHSPAQFAPSVEFLPDAHNQMLVPSERADEVRALVQEACNGVA